MKRETLRRIEESLFRSSWDDGLLDLVAGLGLVLVGVAWLADWIALMPGIPLLFVALWPVARRRWVEPRAGSARSGSERRREQRKRLLQSLHAGWLLLVVVLLLAWATASGRLAVPAAMAPAIPVAIVGGMAVAAAGLLGLARFAGYGALVVGVGALGLLAGAGPGTLLVAGGAAVAALGALRFARFLRSHPVAEPDA